MTFDFFNRLLNRRSALKAMGAAAAGLVGMGAGRADALAAMSAFTAASIREDEKQENERLTDNGALARILPDFSEETRRRLGRLVGSSDFSGRIPGEVVRDIAVSEHKSANAVMLGLLPLARSFSRPPISDFHVGAVARGGSGSLYLGFNIEIPGQMLGFAVHGEQAALSSAYMHGEGSVTAIGIAGGAPCGHCRQFMNEFSPDGEMEVAIQGASIQESAPVKLAELLPRPFGPRALGRKEGALPVRETGLVLAEGSHSVPLTESAGDARDARLSTSDGVVLAAVEAARRSYAPYSGAHSGVAIAARSGRIYKGSYIENVAFNPSLSPLQTALVQMIVAGEDYAAITRVALAEIPPQYAKTARTGDPGIPPQYAKTARTGDFGMRGAKISQKSAAEAVVGAVARGVRLELVDIS